MLKFSCMKKVIIILTLILLNVNSAYAKVIHVNLDDMIQIGFQHNQQMKIKRLELEAAEKDIKIANRLQNPQIQSNIVMGNVASWEFLRRQASLFLLK